MKHIVVVMLLVALLGRNKVQAVWLGGLRVDAFRAARGCFVAWLWGKLPFYHFSVGVERNKMKSDSTLKHTCGLLMKENCLEGVKLRCQVKTKVFDGLCSAAASLTVISVKAVSGMITESIKGQLQLIYPIFYIMLVIMIASCAFQIKSVNAFFLIFLCVDSLFFPSLLCVSLLLNSLLTANLNICHICFLEKQR